jgi:hypothetical protein
MVRYLLEWAGATWSLIDRKRIGHVAVTALDKADQLLLKVRESIATDGISRDARDKSKVTQEHGEDPQTGSAKKKKNSPLAWNVDSISNADKPYEPAASK